MSKKSFIATKLLTEFLHDPLGIDALQPALSWQMASEDRDALQSAFQVQVSTSPSDFSGGNLLCDSGKVLTDAMSVKYSGPPLHSMQRLSWRVKVWNQFDNDSDWSGVACWEMGLLNPSDWQADWIEVSWEEDPKISNPSPYFRRSFSVNAPILSARLYVTSHGLYEAWINGQRVGDQVFTPGYTAYDMRLQYQVYDVSTLLKEGENALGAILGDGWFRGNYANGIRNVYGTRLGLLAYLIVNTQGGQIRVSTDSLWKATTGPILVSDLREGEVYDARLELPSWSCAPYDDHDWKGVRVVSHPKHILVASMGVPVRRKEVFHPEVLRTPNGETVLDFGQNLAGVVHLKLSGPEGTEVKLTHGEVLDKDGNFTISNIIMPGSKEGRANPFQQVRYILKGEGIEEYEPHFTVHGFRYAKIEGYPGDPHPDDFYSVAIYSDMQPLGSFECSEPLINRLHKNIEWSMKSNFLDQPTDCPTRERSGWTGDAQVFATSAAFLMDTRAFFSKWLTQLIDEQLPDGRIGNFVPDPYRLVRGVMKKIISTISYSAGWADAGVILPWTMFQAYGDRQFLENQYESMKAWVEYVRRQAKKMHWSKKINPRYWFDKHSRQRQQYIWDTGYHWGEWLEPAENMLASLTVMPKHLLFSCPVVAAAYFAHSSETLAKAAEILGKSKDAREYQALSEQVKAAYASEFIASDGRIKPDRQASYVRVLAFDLAPEHLRPAIVDHLARLVRASGCHVGTGFLSTKFLLTILANYGHLDLAYEILNQKTRPSWLYQILKGATTIWESWAGIKEDGTPQNSLNHYSPGASVNFLHQVVAGITALEPGYRRIAIKPQPGGGLTYAKAEYDSVKGRIVSEWQLSNGLMTLNLTIPPNTKAEVTLPGALLEQVTESGNQLTSQPFKDISKQLINDVVLNLGSGTYKLVYPVVSMH